MAAQKFEKGASVWQMFNDYWKMCQELWIPEDEDEYWEKVIDLSNEFYKKYQNPFAKSLAMALVEELDRKWKEQGGRNVKTK